MTPHDVLGWKLEVGQLVAVAESNLSRHLNLGIVEQVLTSTGNVDVRTVVLDRIPEEQIERFSFPANQVISMPFAALNHHNPLHARLINIMFSIPKSNQ